MLINSILSNMQKRLLYVYNNSYILKNIDWLIFVNIVLLILSSTICQSDNIGYFAIFVIILTAIKLCSQPGAHFTMTRGDKFLLLYFLIVLISVAGSSLLALSLKGFCKTVVYLGLYISVIQYLKDNKGMIKYILLTIALAAFGETLIAFQQNFLSVSEISGWQDVSRLNPEEVMTRVYGSLKPYNPNLFGGYMLAVVPTILTSVFLPLRNRHYKTALCGFLFFVMAAVAIILTGCRGAYIGLFVECLVLSIFTYNILKPYYKKLFTFISGICISIISLIVITLPALRARIFSIFAMRNDSSNSFRFNVYHSCLDMFKDNWLLGIGVGNQNFREIYGLYMKTGFDALSAYNIYLEIAVESGIFALITFIAFIYDNLSKAVNFILKRHSVKSIYLIITLTSITGILIHGFVDTVFFRPQIQFIFWIMIGIIRVLTNSRSVLNVEIRN